MRRSRGPAFDRNLPGFHCYGIDLSLTARQMGLRSWAIDVFVWHKYWDAEGRLIESREKSAKILGRQKDGFREGFSASADYVGKKWRHHLPFRSTFFDWQ